MLRIKLKELRERKGVSQQEFATAIGVAQSAVGNWESGTREPRTLEQLTKIADYFEVSTDYLLDRAIQEEKPIPVSEDGPRADAHRLLDQVPADKLAEAMRYMKFITASSDTE